PPVPPSASPDEPPDDPPDDPDEPDEPDETPAAPHAPVVTLQVEPAALPPQSVFDVQPPHAPAALHTGVGLLHCAFVVHATHLPALVPDVAQCAPGHSASAAHALHLFVVVSQTGVAPEQSVFATH